MVLQGTMPLLQGSNIHVPLAGRTRFTLSYPPHGLNASMASFFLRVVDHTQRRTTVSGTPLDQWSARRRDLSLATHNTHKKTHVPSESRTHNLSRQAAADLRFRPRGHCDRPLPSCFLPWMSILILSCHQYTRIYSIWVFHIKRYTYLSFSALLV